MTAQELIAKLEKFPPQTPVAIPADFGDLPWKVVERAEIEPNFHGVSPVLLK